jgi:LacI family transcriptional regulator
VTTIRDVAERAQVSVATVSRVINGNPAVNPAIRRVVSEAIEELQFQPNPIARILKTAQTHTVGLLVADIRSSEATTAIWGAEAVAHERGYALLVANSRLNAATGVQHLSSLLERRIDGLLCSSAVPFNIVHDFVQRTGVPAVVYGRSAPSDLLPSTLINYRAATKEAVDHLVGLGHRRFGMIMRETDVGVENRLGTLRPYIHDVLRARGIETYPEFNRTATSPEECTRVVHDLLTAKPCPTALLVLTPYLIRPTLAAIRVAGVRIPSGVSVVAYGESDWSELVEPPLNVIAIDYAAHLEAASRLLFSLIEKEDSQPPMIEHHAQYVRRGSVQAPRDRGGGRGDSAKSGSRNAESAK